MPALTPEQVVGVVGAGTMGGGVAQIAAAVGHPVRLFDLQNNAPESAISRIDTALARLVDKGRIGEAQRIALTAPVDHKLPGRGSGPAVLRHPLDVPFL